VATLRDIKNRIKSIKNTEQITRAMKMVSAAKFRRAQDMTLAGREYYHHVSSITRSLAGLAGRGAHPLFRQKTERNIDLILFTSDKGLCGSFNSYLIKKALTFMEEKASTSVTLISVGKKGRDYFHRRDVEMAAEFLDISRSIGLPLAREIAAKALERLRAGQAQATYVIYSRFISALNQKPEVFRLFPVPPAPPEEIPPVEYLYEPNRDALIRKLIPLYTDIVMNQVLWESTASEHGSRMTAMDTATKNAGELIEQLNLFYNKARQAAITKELIEVVSGADALEG
jgi:F-type H+-transporting ATPase subunit gamma